MLIKSKDNKELGIKQRTITDGRIVTLEVILISIHSFLQWTATCVICDVIPDAINLRDSCDDVCNATQTQAADQICLVFIMQSFQRKQLAKNEDDKFGLSLHWPETEQELMITWSLDFAAMYDIAIGVFGMSSATMPRLAIEPISKSISDLKGSIITRLQGRLDISDVAARVIHKVPKQPILAFSIAPVRMSI
jgi:hypothetical protein